MKKKIRKSVYWKHFTELESDDELRRITRCEHCHQVFSMPSHNFGNMARHIKNKHPAINMMIREAEGMDTSETQINSDTEIEYETEAEDGDDSEASTVETDQKKDLSNALELKQKKRRSVYWKHFTVIDDDGVGGRARCKHCDREIAINKGNSGNLARHLKALHPAVMVMIAEAEGRHISVTQTDTGTEVEYLTEEGLEPDRKKDPSNDKRKRSVYWNHFTELKSLDDDDDRRRARCDHCAQVIVIAGGNIGNLVRHFKNKHHALEIMIQKSEGRYLSETETQTAVEYLTEDGLDSETDRKRDSSNDIELKDKRKRSVYWNHFTELKSFDDDENRRRGRCKHCGRVIVIARGNIGNLVRHLKSLHPDEMGDGQDLSETQADTETQADSETEQVEYETEDGRKFYIVPADKTRTKRRKLDPTPSQNNTHKNISILESLPALIKKKELDKFDIFGTLVAMKMRELDSRQQVLVEKVINDALHEAEVNSWGATSQSMGYKAEDPLNSLQDS